MGKTEACVTIFSFALIALMILLLYLIAKMHPVPRSNMTLISLHPRGFKDITGTHTSGECDRLHGKCKRIMLGGANSTAASNKTSVPTTSEGATRPALLYRGKPFVFTTEQVERGLLYRMPINRKPGQDRESKNIVFKVVDEDDIPKFEIKINNVVSKMKTQKRIPQSKSDKTADKTVDEESDSNDTTKVIILKMLTDGVIMIDDDTTATNNTSLDKHAFEIFSKSREKVLNIIEAILGNNVTFVKPKYIPNNSNSHINNTIVNKLLERNAAMINNSRTGTTEELPSLFKRTSLLTDITNDEIVRF